MVLHEECGVFGIISPMTADVAGTAYYGLYALQHRGQESCGIVVNDDGVFFSHKDLGLVSEVFTTETLSRLPKGNMAVGHVRYGTTGGNRRSNCQPIEVNHQKGRMALAQTEISAMPPYSAMNLNYPAQFFILPAIRRPLLILSQKSV